MRLIDIEAPCKIEIKLDGEKCHATVTAPTIDAVPVVRCKDCKHNLHPGKPNTVCGLNIPIFDGNGYCSEGERKDDE